jgi:hypothetical protein
MTFLVCFVCLLAPCASGTSNTEHFTAVRYVATHVEIVLETSIKSLAAIRNVYIVFLFSNTVDGSASHP